MLLLLPPPPASLSSLLPTQPPGSPEDTGWGIKLRISCSSEKNVLFKTCNTDLINIVK